MSVDYEAMDLNPLIELAKKRELVDSVVFERPRYRVEIGAARFLLDAAGTREFLIKLLRGRTPRRDDA